MADSTKIDMNEVYDMLSGGAKDPNKDAKALIDSIKKAADAGCASGQANVTFAGSVSTKINDGKPQIDLGLSFQTECVGAPQTIQPSKDQKPDLKQKEVDATPTKVGRAPQPVAFS